jgi:peroxiredoxin
MSGFRGITVVTVFVCAVASFGQNPPQPGGQSAYQAQLAQMAALHPTLAIGSPAPDFNLKGVDGKLHSLGDYRSSPVLAVAFICNHCPASQLYEARISKLVAEYTAKGLTLIAIQPNGPQAMAPRELNFTDLDDSFESMVQHAQYRRFAFPYLYDGDKQEIVQKFGPRVTPHIFIFDSDRRLRYEGRIDDNMRPTLVKSEDARNAIEALLAGKDVPVSHTAVFGCSTKWNDQTQNRERELAAWAATPVKLEPADTQALKTLRANPTGKTLMVAFWATWCGPCVEEFDDVLNTYLWYRSRDFELVTVSVDDPENKPAVQKFLEQHHSAVRNLQFASEDVYALQAAFDESFDSGVPFTMIIAPDGKVIYREAGLISMLQMRRTILASLPDSNQFPGNPSYWAAK